MRYTRPLAAVALTTGGLLILPTGTALAHGGSLDVYCHDGVAGWSGSVHAWPDGTTFTLVVDGVTIGTVVVGVDGVPGDLTHSAPLDPSLPHTVRLSATGSPDGWPDLVLTDSAPACLTPTTTTGPAPTTTEATTSTSSTPSTSTPTTTSPSATPTVPSSTAPPAPPPSSSSVPSSTANSLPPICPPTPPTNEMPPGICGEPSTTTSSPTAAPTTGSPPTGPSSMPASASSTLPPSSSLPPTGGSSAPLAAIAAALAVTGLALVGLNRRARS